MNKGEDIIVFDGDCMVCHFFIRYVLENDGGKFCFVAAQSIEGRALAQQHQLPGFSNNESVYYIHQRKVYTHSTAIARVLRYCGRSGTFLSKLLLLCPRFLRDFLYRAFARIRKKIIPPACMLLGPAEKKRVIL